jgi:hypothetical protein
MSSPTRSRPGSRLDRGAQPVREVDRAAEQALTVALELAAGGVDRRQQQR